MIHESDLYHDTRQLTVKTCKSSIDSISLSSFLVSDSPFDVKSTCWSFKPSSVFIYFWVIEVCACTNLYWWLFAANISLWSLFQYTIAMMGYGPEDKNAVLELTYNYGVTEYDKGNGYAQVEMLLYPSTLPGWIISLTYGTINILLCHYRAISSEPNNVIGLCPCR